MGQGWSQERAWGPELPWSGSRVQSACTAFLERPQRGCAEKAQKMVGQVASGFRASVLSMSGPALRGRVPGAIRSAFPGWDLREDPQW